MKDYTSTIEKLKYRSDLYFKRVALEAADAIEELMAEVKRLTEENKELCSKIDYCTRVATATGTEDLDKMWQRFDELLDSLGKMED